MFLCVSKKGAYYQELLSENGISRKRIIARANVSAKTLDNFFHDRIEISFSKFAAIDEAIREEIIANKANNLKLEGDRLLDEIQKVYKRLPPDMQLQTLEHVRGLERIELSRSNKSY